MTNSDRHISVLGSNQTKYATSSPRYRKFSAWLLFIAMLVLAILNDSSVWFLTIPDFSSASVMQGTLSINSKTRKIDRTLSLSNDAIKTKFTCRIKPSRGGDCLNGFNTEQLELLNDKNAKIYFYKARIASIFLENRLLQLEVNGEVITSGKSRGQPT